MGGRAVAGVCGVFALWYTSQRMKNPWIIIGAITVILIGAAMWYAKSSEQDSNVGIVVPTVHIKGNPDADVKIVEYSDFQCPACAAFQPVVNDMLDTFGDRVSFEYRHFPLSALHPYAEQAARAAEAAGQQGKFFEFHDKLFAEQDSWSAGAAPTTFFLRYAGDLGLDVDQFRLQLRSSLLRDEVRSDAAEGQKAGLTGTPTFFLNGERMEIKTYQDFFDQVARAVDPSYGEATTTPALGGETVRFGI